ncbi:MAG: Xaa-Pro aminopeptidase, partial [Salinivirgaceae bacterium]
TIFNGLKDMGFVKGDTEEAIHAGAHALFFPCGTGHLMGLDVHDMENLGEQYVGYGGEPKSTLFGIKSLRLGRELKPGYVLTIEPGIYFIPELIDLWNSQNKFTQFINYDKVNEYRDFGGTRNEEDILITKNGHKILGKPLAKSIEDVEAERAKAFE